MRRGAVAARCAMLRAMRATARDTRASAIRCFMRHVRSTADAPLRLEHAARSARQRQRLPQGRHYADAIADTFAIFISFIHFASHADIFELTLLLRCHYFATPHYALRIFAAIDIISLTLITIFSPRFRYFRCCHFSSIAAFADATPLLIFTPPCRFTPFSRHAIDYYHMLLFSPLIDTIYFRSETPDCLRHAPASPSSRFIFEVFFAISPLMIHSLSFIFHHFRLISFAAFAAADFTAFFEYFHHCRLPADCRHFDTFSPIYYFILGDE
jgi:hypothetical protein